jgi:hypothetical protein
LRAAAWLERSPDTATPDEVRRFQLHLIESGSSICNRPGCGSCSASRCVATICPIGSFAVKTAKEQQTKVLRWGGRAANIEMNSTASLN